MKQPASDLPGASKYGKYEELYRNSASSTDVLHWPLIGRMLLKPSARYVLQLPLLIIGIVMIVHGLFGPTLAPKNLATVLSWVHYRGALVMILLLSGNFFCMACPFMLPRNIARRFLTPSRSWPKVLRNKWFSLALFVTILFSYELFHLWSSPLWTALIIVAYFAAALTVDALFKNATFCKYVCPIGQFNFLSSTISPLEVRVRDLQTCSDCKTHDCIKGRKDPVIPERVIQPGCELALFLPMKVGNMDCTFCLDCARACPHDNVGLVSRMPAVELVTDVPRSGIGRLARRPDIAIYGVVFMFGALINAFGMVSPVYVVEAWLSHTLGIHSFAAILAILFAVVLIIEPIALLAAAGWLTKRWSGSSASVTDLVCRFCYSIVPLGFAMWLAHYSFHFLTGLLTFIPVAQNTLIHLGVTLFGRPRWEFGGLPRAAASPIEMGYLGLGLLGSLFVGHRISEQEAPGKAWKAFAPWAAVIVALWLCALWLLSQPMEMRGTFLSG